ncbi:MAG: hypothetical protein GQ528_11695 [Woeseiaceae bacterium]|nr:hypothetical protein [Woeseiaceae bacterium]
MQPGVSGLFQSYKHGGGQQPLLGRSVRDVLDQAVARWPDCEAMLVPLQRIRWSWHELHRQVRELAAGLILIKINPACRPPELEFPLDKVGRRIGRARCHVQARCTHAYV